MNKEILDNIIKEVVINRHSTFKLHKRERLEFQYEQGWLAIAKEDVYQIIKEYEEYKNKN